MRRRKIILILAAFAGIAGWLAWIVLSPSSEPPISIGVRSYELWAGRGPSLEVHVGITNTGSTTIKYSQLSFDRDGWLQIETSNVWSTHDIGPIASIAFTRDLLPPGSNTTALLALPEGTSRWRVGYSVQAASRRERVTEKIPPSWRTHLRWFLNRISDEETETLVTSAVFECPSNLPAGRDERKSLLWYDGP